MKYIPTRRIATHPVAFLTAHAKNRFSSVDELCTQVARDAEEARAFLRDNAPEL